MKVLVIQTNKVGGVAVHVNEIKKELQKCRINVTVVNRTEDLGLKNFHTSYLKLKRFFRAASKQYDIIHAHDWSIAYPAIKSGIKNLIATFHGFPTNPAAKYFQDFCIKSLGNRAIVVSPKMKSIYQKATLINNGVDLDLFKKAGKREKDLVGVAQNYNLKEIQKVVSSLNLRLAIARGVPYEKMPEFYSKLDIFISLPPKSTGFNMVWLEAMACEVPHIIGTADGIGESLPINKVSNYSQLKERLIAITENKLNPLKNQKGWLSHTGLTWKHHANKLVKIYEEVAS